MDKNKNEKFAESWFAANGFAFKLKKQHMNKTIYEISRDGLTYDWELPFGITEMKDYMELACRENHNMRLLISKMQEGNN